MLFIVATSGRSRNNGRMSLAKLSGIFRPPLMLRTSIWAWQRFQVFNQIEFLSVGQSQIKVNVVVIEQCGKPAVVIKPALVGRTHEQTLFADEETVQVHRLVNVVWPSVGLEAVDANLFRLVPIHTRRRSRGRRQRQRATP